MQKECSVVSLGLTDSARVKNCTTICTSILGDIFTSSAWLSYKIQGTIHRWLQIGRDGHLDQSEAYDISEHVREYATSSAWFSQLSAG